MKPHSRPFLTRIAAGILLLAGCLAGAIACSGGSSDESTPAGSPASPGSTVATAGATRADASGVAVVQAVISTDVTEDHGPSGLVSRVLPIDTRNLFAVLLLDGVSPGMDITGKWYQLSVPDADPNGTEVSSGTVTLSEVSVKGGQAGVALLLSGGPQNLPPGDWLVRVYANDVLIRTMAFVISPVVTQAQLPAADGTQVPEIPVGGEYTVKAGDSLQGIAQALKAPNETEELFLSRLILLNDLQAGKPLLVGQILKVPAAP